MDRLSSTPEETIMVGDSRFDIDSARNAGVRSVLVAWQLAMSEEEINGDNGPDHIIHRPKICSRSLMDKSGSYQIRGKR